MNKGLLKFSINFVLLFYFSSILFKNDAPYPWQIGFQDPASPGFEGITVLHDNICFFLVLILLGVF
jgi:cytochrome c oxidase subunit 2